MKKQILGLGLFMSMVSLRLNAAIVDGANVQLANNGNGDWTLTVTHQNGTYSGLVFSDSNSGGPGSTLTPVFWTVDTEADYYLAPAGAQFTAATIAAGQFPSFFVLNNPSQINVPYGDFYLGINTGDSWLSPGIPARDEFGWVELQNSRTGLALVGDAMAYGTDGIVIGTNDVIAVPESAGWGIAGAMLFLACCSIKRPLWAVRPFQSQPDAGSGSWQFVGSAELHINGRILPFKTAGGLKPIATVPRCPFPIAGLASLK